MPISKYTFVAIMFAPALNALQERLYPLAIAYGVILIIACVKEIVSINQNLA